MLGWLTLTWGLSMVGSQKFRQTAGMEEEVDAIEYSNTSQKKRRWWVS
jgi:hypothetical protein